MLPRPKFSLRTGLICFLVASVFLGLQFRERFSRPKIDGAIDAVYGWPVVILRCPAALYAEREEESEKQASRLEELYGLPVRHVIGIGYIIDLQSQTFSWWAVAVNAAFAAVTALLCAWVAGPV